MTFDEQRQEIETVAPLRVRRVGGRLRSYPDLANYLPSRLISRAEAQMKGWPLFFEAKACGRSLHLAPRYTMNPGRCVDCVREAQGRATIGITLDAPEAA